MTSILKLIPIALLLLAAPSVLAVEDGLQPATASVAVAQRPAGDSALAPFTSEKHASSRSLRDWYALGGWTMHGLAICSVLVIALLAERVWALRRSAVVPGALQRVLTEAMETRRLDQAVDACGASTSALARISAAALRHMRDPARTTIERVRSVGEAEVESLHRNLATLVAIANLATMIGLLGTVLGMIDAFGSVAELGTGDARIVANGIFEALITTATGLTIGVVGIAAHTYLRRRSDRLGAFLEDAVSELFDDFVDASHHEESPMESAADWAPSTR